MEYVILVGLLAFFGYRFMRRNTLRGARTVRAYIFLRALHQGLTVEEANALANQDIISGGQQNIRDAAEYVRRAYEGKQLPMISDALDQGLVLHL